jgi:PatG C-terminal
MQLTDNAGATDEYRMLNYRAVRYPAVYAAAAEAYAREFSLSGVEVSPSGLNRMRKIVNCIFSYPNRHTAVSERSPLICLMPVAGIAHSASGNRKIPSSTTVSADDSGRGEADRGLRARLRRALQSGHLKTLLVRRRH